MNIKLISHLNTLVDTMVQFNNAKLLMAVNNMYVDILLYLKELKIER